MLSDDRNGVSDGERYHGATMGGPCDVLRFTVVTAAGWALLLALVPEPAVASSNGVSTASFPPAAGCNSCHTTANAPVPTVMLFGPTQVPPRSINVYTLTIATTRPAGGFNVSTPTGMLSTGGADATFSKTIRSTGGRTEITHSGAKSAVSGVVTFSFQWTAPASFTSATLLGWGNAVDRANGSAGDRAAPAMLTIVSAGDPTATPTLTPTPNDTMTATPSPTASASATPDIDRADVNCDDSASAADATAFVWVFVSSAPGLCDADVNDDGSLTADDLAELIVAIFGD